MAEALAALAGVALGLFYFGGLWWTARRIARSSQPAWGLAGWVGGSLLLRLGVALPGFVLAAGGQWQRLLACLLGFMAARWAVTRWTRPAHPTEVRHAP